MKIVLSHMTALRYWRSTLDIDVLDDRPEDAQCLDDCTCGILTVRDYRSKFGNAILPEDESLEVLVGESKSRRPSKCVKPYVWRSGLPEGSLCKISKDVYVASPEFMFLQLASKLDFVELARLGNEICGTYSLHPNARFTERVPLTTKEKLEAFARSAEQARGKKRALRALRWVANGSASPRETITLLALRMPRRLGGCGLPLPELNKECSISARLQQYVNGGKYRPDFMWEVRRNGKTIRVTAEYDSAEHHDGDEDAERTRIRRNDFQAMRYYVTSINKSQLLSAASFEVPARQIMRDLAIYRPATSISELSLRDSLLTQLRTGGVF